MKFFSKNNGEISLDREELELLPQVKALFRLEYNKAPKDKDGRLRIRAKKELTYVYFMYDFTSIFAQMSEEDRKTYSLQSASLPEDYEISSELKNLIDWFVSIQESTSFSLVLLKKARKAAYKLGDYFDNVNFNEKDDQGRPIYNIKQFIDTVKQLSDVIDGLNSLENSVKNELATEGKLYGDAKKGIEED